MNKSELVTAMAGVSGLTKKDSEAALNGLIKSIEDAVARKEDVRLMGFGTFSVVERAARIGRNPSTGEEIKIPAREAVKFKVGKDLKLAAKGA
jgi:DNA-binding protein HU-beta